MHTIIGHLFPRPDLLTSDGMTFSIWTDKTQHWQTPQLWTFLCLIRILWIMRARHPSLNFLNMNLRDWLKKVYNYHAIWQWLLITYLPWNTDWLPSPKQNALPFRSACPLNKQWNCNIPIKLPLYLNVIKDADT